MAKRKRKQINDRRADVILGLGLVSFGILSAAYRERLVQLVVANRAMPIPSLLELIRKDLMAFAPVMAQSVADVQIASWVAGIEKIAYRLNKPAMNAIFAQTAASSIPTKPVTQENFTLRAIEAGPVIDLMDGPPEPVIQYPKIIEGVNQLIGKKVVTRPMFDQMTKQAKVNAFTVAHVASESTIEKIKDAVIEAVADGTSLKEFAAKVNEAVETSKLSPAHVENVFRTNVQKAYSEGQEKLVKGNPVVSQVFPYAGIRPIQDGRVRDNHLVMETMGLDGTHIYRSDDPVWDWLTPPIDFNCFPGDTKVSGSFSRGYRALYKGAVVEIVTESGNRLTVTANHPVLTDQGWVSADRLFEGMNVFRAFGEVEIDREPSDHQKDEPITAADCFDAIGKCSPGHTRKPRAQDFYGDAGSFTSNIDIVDIDIELLDVVAPNGGSEFSFIGMDPRLSFESGFGLKQFGLPASNTSTAGFPCGGELAFSHVRRSSSPFDRFLFGGGSPFDAMVAKYAIDNLSAKIECHRATLDGQSIRVLGNDLCLDVIRDAEYRLLNSDAVLDRWTPERPQFLDSVVERVVRDSILAGHFNDGLGGIQVVSDRIVKCSIRHLERPIEVFDFEAIDSIVVANGIVTHNCRCRKIYYTIRQAAKFGVREALEWLETGKPPKQATHRGPELEQYRPTNGFVSPGAAA